MIRVKVFGTNGRIASLIRQEMETDKRFVSEDLHPDVLIDFTHRSLLEKHIEEALSTQRPLIIGTTDLNEQDKASLLEFSRNQKVFYSPNMSTGVMALKCALKAALEVLSDTHCPEIHELHHGLKKDAPSGTALMLADFIKNMNFGWDNIKDYQVAPLRGSNDIGMSVNRGGSGYSTHTVSLMGDGNMLEIKYHNWNSRIFAQGALKAAEFLMSVKAQSGFYTMEHLLNHDYRN